VALEELIQDWREVGHGCVGGMGWTGDGDVWEIFKVKCWEQGKFVYLWAERVNSIQRVECSRGGGGGILDSSLVSFAFAFVGSSRSSLPAALIALACLGTLSTLQRLKAPPAKHRRFMQTLFLSFLQLTTFQLHLPLPLYCPMFPSQNLTALETCSEKDIAQRRPRPPFIV
jgi:hypothetical protein